MCTGRTYTENSAAVRININGLTPADGKLRCGLRLVAQNHRRWLTHPGAANRLQQFVHRPWLGVLGNRNRPKIPVHELNNLPFEGQQHPGGSHDKDEQTGCYASRQMQPEKSLANHHSSRVTNDSSMTG